MKPRLYIQLGRLGDILNVLPLCRQDFEDTGVRPVLMVAEPYLDLLDGVTYVEPLVWRGEFEDVRGAWDMAAGIAEARGLALVCTQIYGRTLATAECCSSFLRESWAAVPKAPAWGSLPLLFDRRDASREAGVKNQLLKRGTGKPYIVLALQGTSSPFAHHATLSAYLRNKLGKDFDFIDVTAYRAPRFYDLLLLLEGAHALVTVDSAVLHLAAAVPKLPVVAFITREPSGWHGTAWRPQHVARIFYDEMPEASASVVHALATSRGGRVTPWIFHAWSHYQADKVDRETMRRMDFARCTWRREQASWFWMDREFQAEHEKRSSAALDDPRPVPFVKDVIEYAIGPEWVESHDIVAFSNADVSFVPGLSGWILDRMAREECAFTHRRDFERLTHTIESEADARRGAWYPGSDAFFFTVAWWRRHRDEYPDMLLGREQSDEVLRQLIKRHGGREIPDAIYHEKHRSFWEHDGNKESNPGNQYNRRLARKWFLKTGYGPNDPQWWKIPGGTAR